MYVIEDGRVALEYEEAEVDTCGLEIESATEHRLISNGTLSTVLAPGQPLPPDAKTSVLLNGTGCSVVGQFSGTVSVEQLQDESWQIDVADAEKTIFSYQVAFKSEANRIEDGCDATCAHGYCSASGSGINWCFCDIFGYPHCSHIRLFLVHSSD